MSSMHFLLSLFLLSQPIATTASQSKANQWRVFVDAQNIGRIRQHHWPGEVGESPIIEIPVLKALVDTFAAEGMEVVLSMPEALLDFENPATAWFAHHFYDDVEQAREFFTNPINFTVLQTANILIKRGAISIPDLHDDPTFLVEAEKSSMDRLSAVLSQDKFRDPLLPALSPNVALPRVSLHSSHGFQHILIMCPREGWPKSVLAAELPVVTQHQMSPERAHQDAEMKVAWTNYKTSAAARFEARMAAKSANKAAVQFADQAHRTALHAERKAKFAQRDTEHEGAAPPLAPPLPLLDVPMMAEFLAEMRCSTLGSGYRHEMTAVSEAMEQHFQRPRGPWLEAAWDLLKSVAEANPLWRYAVSHANNTVAYWERAEETRRAELRREEEQSSEEKKRIFDEWCEAHAAEWELRHKEKTQQKACKMLAVSQMQDRYAQRVAPAMALLRRNAADALFWSLLPKTTATAPTRFQHEAFHKLKHFRPKNNSVDDYTIVASNVIARLVTMLKPDIEPLLAKTDQLRHVAARYIGKSDHSVPMSIHSILYQALLTIRWEDDNWDKTSKRQPLVRSGEGSRRAEDFPAAPYFDGSFLTAVKGKTALCEETRKLRPEERRIVDEIWSNMQIEDGCDDSRITDVAEYLASIISTKRGTVRSTAEGAWHVASTGKRDPFFNVSLYTVQTSKVTETSAPVATTTSNKKSGKKKGKKSAARKAELASRKKKHGSATCTPAMKWLGKVEPTAKTQTQNLNVTSFTHGETGQDMKAMVFSNSGNALADLRRLRDNLPSYVTEEDPRKGSLELSLMLRALFHQYDDMSDLTWRDDQPKNPLVVGAARELLHLRPNATPKQEGPLQQLADRLQASAVYSSQNERKNKLIKDAVRRSVASQRSMQDVVERLRASGANVQMGSPNAMARVIQGRESDFSSSAVADFGSMLSIQSAAQPGGIVPGFGPEQLKHLAQASLAELGDDSGTMQRLIKSQLSKQKAEEQLKAFAERAQTSQEARHTEAKDASAAGAGADNAESFSGHGIEEDVRFE